MKKRYYLLFLLSFFAFLPLAQAGAAPAGIPAPASFAVAAEGSEMSRAEQRQLRKELRQAARQARKAQRDDDQILEIVCALIIPPLGVYLHERDITTNFWVSLILTVLMWFPGAIFSLLVVLDVFSL